MKYHKASALQPYEFLRPVYSFFADMLIFSAHFTSYQVIGVATIFLAFLVQLIYYNYYEEAETNVEKKKLIDPNAVRSDGIEI